MIYSFNCTALPSALEELKKIISRNETNDVKTVIFCEDRLTLAAERTVCAAVGGTFSTSVYTLARFLATEKGKPDNVLSGQGSAMAVRKIIEEHKGELKLFRKLSAPQSAQSVYDTVALLYSSRVTAEEAAEAAQRGGILGGKLHDIAVIYSAYEKYLKENGKQDRNGYLRQLPDVIQNSPKIIGGDVVFLGFQAFTCMAAECVRSACRAAKNVYGMFLGGNEDIYVNEAGATFSGIAQEFGGLKNVPAENVLEREADILRRALFNPESFYKAAQPAENVSIFEASDEEEEFEFIAASIKKHVIDYGERYAKISVMLPDLEKNERALARTFSRFKIPYYADRQLSLSEHPLCAFVVNYLLCAFAGCRFADVDAVVSSPYFPAVNAAKDMFRNYMLRLANYRGGIKREPKKEIAENLGFDTDTVENVRKIFLKGLSFLTVKGGNSAICAGVRALFAVFNVQETLKNTAEKYKDEKPAAAQFGARACESVLNVLGEAELIAGDGKDAGEFIKILKSGFAAMKISLIPPKADAVFVGDLGATANTGSNVVFAARLTDGVPDASSDTSLLTDREITALESVNLNISPKIRQVNLRKREICALNVCAFRQRLYLTYPARLNGEECGASEIISYARAAFCLKHGVPLAPVNLRKIERSGKAAPYYCSEKLPALKRLSKYANSAETSTVYDVLKRNGFEKEALDVLEKPLKRGISYGKRLYFGRTASLSPTALEGYFACPYLNFMRQGLKLKEREEGAVRAVDAGNFIHSVLQDLAGEVNGIDDCEVFGARAKIVAEEKLAKPPYSALADSKSGQYASGELIEEAVKVSRGMFEQIKNSSFKVAQAECPSEIYLSCGVKIYGRIDRVDESGDLVRIIDYKTGGFDSTAAKYYTGAKLQLPLYLLSVSKGKRAAGAYYFPAAAEYKEKEDGVFRLQGFMDGSDEVIKASDTAVEPKKKSGYVEAYYQGRKVESAMPAEDFGDFLQYSRLVADGAVKEMLAGNITPSPAEGVCKYCGAGGSCGFSAVKDGEERKGKSVKCSQIAEIVRKERGDAADR